MAIWKKGDKARRPILPYIYKGTVRRVGRQEGTRDFVWLWVEEIEPDIEDFEPFELLCKADDLIRME